MDEKIKIDFASRVHENLQKIISHADSKANMTLSIQSLLIGIGLGASLLTKTLENIQKLEMIYFWIFLAIMGVFIISSIVGILISVYIYWARLPLEEIEVTREGLSYFGHISHFPSSKEYFDSVKDINSEGILKEISCQVYSLSLIAKKKMDAVNCSVVFLILNIFLTILLLGFCVYVGSLSNTNGGT